MSVRIDRHPLPSYESLPPITMLPIIPVEPGPGAFPTSLESLVPPASGIDEVYWETLRTQFDLVSGLTFLNNGTYAPPPRLVIEAHHRWVRYLAANPHAYIADILVNDARKSAAALINSEPDEIALTRSTTEGINLLVHGLDWAEGDEIILDRNDHFTAFKSFLTLTGRYGVKLVFVDLGAEPGTEEDILKKYAEKITSKTKLLFLNWVNYRTGRQLPIEQLAELGRAHDLIVSVDTAQAVGIVPIDVKELAVDHIAAPSHKWLFAGPGGGFSFFSSRIIERVWPVMGPGGSQRHLGRAAGVLDNNEPLNIPTVAAFNEALKFRESVGFNNISDRLFYLSSQIHDGLDDIGWGRVITPREKNQGSVLTTFDVGVGRNADAVAEILFKKFNIKINSELFVGLNALRISPHLFTSQSQIDYFLYALKGL